MTLDSVLTGIVTGVVASIIIIVMQTIFDYIKRKKYEMFHFYEFDSFDIDECAPPEYLRESGNAGHTKVKMELPFDMKCVRKTYSICTQTWEYPKVCVNLQTDVR